MTDDKRNRRRFLANMLFAGAALTGAAFLARSATGHAEGRLSKAANPSSSPTESFFHDPDPVATPQKMVFPTVEERHTAGGARPTLCLPERDVQIRASRRPGRQ